MRFKLQMLMNIIMALLLVYYFAGASSLKQIASVDLRSITEDFSSIAIQSNLSEDKLEAITALFAESLDKNIKQLSNEYHILSKSAIVTQSNDLTEKLKEMVYGDITSAGK